MAITGDLFKHVHWTSLYTGPPHGTDNWWRPKYVRLASGRYASYWYAWTIFILIFKIIHSWSVLVNRHKDRGHKKCYLKIWDFTTSNKNHNLTWHATSVNSLRPAKKLIEWTHKLNQHPGSIFLICLKDQFLTHEFTDWPFIRWTDLLPCDKMFSS